MTKKKVTKPKGIIMVKAESKPKPVPFRPVVQTVGNAKRTLRGFRK